MKRLWMLIITLAVIGVVESMGAEHMLSRDDVTSETDSTNVPDEKFRESCAYFLVHKLTPKFVEMYNGGELGDEIFEYVGSWRQIVDSMVEKPFVYDWENLSVEKTEKDGHVIYLYTYPAPKTMTEPSYAAIIVTEGKARYFVLEYSPFAESQYVLCEWNDGHLNYGEITPTKEGMIDSSIKIIANPTEPEANIKFTK